MLHNSFSKEIFPNIKSKPPLTQPEAVSSHPITSHLGEETNTHLTTTSFQVVVESDKVSPPPPEVAEKATRQQSQAAVFRDKAFEVGSKVQQRC